MTLVQQRIFGGFSLKLKNKCGAQNSIKERGMRGKGDRLLGILMLPNLDWTDCLWGVEIFSAGIRVVAQPWRRTRKLDLTSRSCVAPLRLGGLRGKQSTPSDLLGGTGEVSMVSKQDRNGMTDDTRRKHSGKGTLSGWMIDERKIYVRIWLK